MKLMCVTLYQPFFHVAKLMRPDLSDHLTRVILPNQSFSPRWDASSDMWPELCAFNCELLGWTQLLYQQQLYVCWTVLQVLLNCNYWRVLNRLAGASVKVCFGRSNAPPLLLQAFHTRLSQEGLPSALKSRCNNWKVKRPTPLSLLCQPDQKKAVTQSSVDI